METKLTKSIELAKSDVLCAIYESTKPGHGTEPAIYDALQDALAALDKALLEARKAAK